MPAEMQTDVDEQRRRGNQSGAVTDVFLRDDVSAAAGRVGVNRLPVREGHNSEQRGDDKADRNGVAERADTGNDQRREDEVGGVCDRRQRVGRQHGQSRNARQALVMRHARGDRLADQQPFERKGSSLFRHVP